MAERAHLARLEPLGDQLVAGHQADGGGQARRARRRPGRARRRRRGRGERGYTWPTLVEHPVEAEVARRRPARARSSLAASPPSRSSWSCGGAHRALDAAQRVAGEQLVDAARGPAAAPRPQVAKRLPSVVAWAATLWLRPTITRSACSAARRGQAGQGGDHAVAHEQRAASRTWSCSTFSVRSRLVMPLWMCSWPARAENSSMRAFTSWRVTRSRAVDRGQVDLVDHGLVGLDDAVGHLDAQVAWARSTASQSRRSSTTLCSARPQLDHGLAGVPGWRARSGEVTWLESVLKTRYSCCRGCSHVRGSTRQPSHADTGVLPWKDRCDRHQFDPAVDRCGRAATSFCIDVPRVPLGPPKPPYCLPCAVDAAGVRNGRARARRSRGVSGASSRKERSARPTPRAAARPAEAGRRRRRDWMTKVS